jgi:PAS domain S-box-containing protein
MTLDIQSIQEFSLQKTILIVEDDALQLGQLIRTFSLLFKEVYSASNGQDALQIYFDKRPSLVISDINMPHINGIKLFEEIHKDDPYVPLIVLSADAEEESFINAMYAGANVFLYKPLNLQELYKNLYIQLSRLSNVKKLKRKDQLYDTLFVHTAKGIVLLDPLTGHFVEFNSYAHEMLGYTFDEYSALRLVDIEADELLEDIQHNLDFIHENGTRTFERRHRRKDGSLLDVSVTAVYLEMENSPFYLVTFTDITDRIIKEKMLHNALEDAEKLNHTKDIFLASMSHEIRTPLNSIIGMLGLLSYTDLNQKQTKYINTIKNSSFILKNLINDILDYSKLESGKLMLENIPFSPSGVIEKTVDSFEVEAKNKGVKLFLDSNFDSRLNIYGDSNRYAQILNNIIGNALKFTHEGYVKIKAEYRVEKEKYVIHVQIIDTGIGMTSDQIALLFNPFEQASIAHTRKYGGTGLGLSISKEFAQMMGGTIEVESSYGMGSCFTVTIPFECALKLNDDDDDDDDDAQFDKNQTVLVVDDSETNLMVITGYLSHYGIKSITAENGVEAIEKVKKNSFDLVFMDIHMPVMNGLDATQEIKKFNVSLPIIALSAAAMDKEKQEAFSIGMNDYLTKPIDINQLLKVIKQYLSVVPSESENRSKIPSNLYGINTAELFRKLRKKEQVVKYLSLFTHEYQAIKRIFPILELESEEMGSIIHKIKGSAGNGSMDRLYSLCQQFESTDHHGGKDQLRIAIANEMEMIVNSIMISEFMP